MKLTHIKEILMNHNAYIKLKESIFPQNLSIDELLSRLNFLKPLIIVLHGSKVSNKRFSTKIQSDFDLIIISKKTPFWSMRVLFKETYEKLSDIMRKIKIDLTIVSFREILIHLKGETSLGLSLMQGFTILGRS